MLSDEERELIEEIQKGNKIGIYELIRTFKREGIENFITVRRKYKDIMINLIEKQSKEIEELKETLKCTQNSWFEDTQKIEEMKKQLDLDNECEIALNSKIMDLEKEIEELKEESKEYQIGFAQGCYEKDLDWEDKIKAKIEEVEQWELYNMKIPRLSTLDERLGAKIGIKYVLQSLLEKE